MGKSGKKSKTTSQAWWKPNKSNPGRKEKMVPIREWERGKTLLTAERSRRQEIAMATGQEGEFPFPLRIDEDLLVEVLAIQSYHKDNDDADMMEFIRETIADIEAECEEKILFRVDEYGSFYVEKGTPPEGHFYPCIVCHTDTVHRIRDNFTVFNENGVIFGMDLYQVKQAGIGGDDKVGVYICLDLLRRMPYVKVNFFRHEEIGCKGSSRAWMGFYENVSMVLQPDRKGCHDFIDHSNGVKVFSEEYHTAIKPLLEKYEYKRCGGLSTDMGQLKVNGLGVSAANISCGYYNPHGDGEFVVVEDVEIALNLCYEIFTQHSNRQWLHKAERPAPVTSTYNYNRTGTNTNAQYNSYNSEATRNFASMHPRGLEDEDMWMGGSFVGYRDRVHRSKYPKSAFPAKDYDSWVFEGLCKVCEGEELMYHDFGYYCEECFGWFTYGGEELEAEEYAALREMEAEYKARAAKAANRQDNPIVALM